MIIEIDTKICSVKSETDYQEISEIKTVENLSILMLLQDAFYAEKDFIPTFNQLIDWINTKKSIIAIINDFKGYKGE